MKDLLKQWGKHVVALILFLGLVMVYFSPAVFDGKVIMQGDNIKATGMGHSQMEQYAKTAQPGEFSAWRDAVCDRIWAGSTKYAFLFDCGWLVEKGGVWRCGYGIRRIGLLLPADVCHGSKLVARDCRGIRFCIRIL